MNFLNGIVSAFGGAVGSSLDAQINQAKSEAQTVAQAVAVRLYCGAPRSGVIVCNSSITRALRTTRAKPEFSSNVMRGR
jgi:hypothetical protein